MKNLAIDWSFILRAKYNSRLKQTLLGKFKAEDAVALTFDDGPDPQYTLDLLSILQSHNVKATFFVIGRQAELYPEVVRRIIEDGHQVANHGYSHSSFSFLSPNQMLREIRYGNIVCPGIREYVFRPPFGHFNRIASAVANDLNYTTVYWSVHANDWQTTDANQIFSALELVRGGDVILLHDRLETATVDKFFERRYMLSALDRYLNKYRNAYQFKTISEMLRLYDPVFVDYQANLTEDEQKIRKTELESLVTNKH